MTIHNFRNYNRTHLSLETSDNIDSFESDVGPDDYLDSYQAVEAQAVQLDTALEDHALLTQLGTVIGQRGLMSAQSAHLLQISTESIQRRLGLQVPIIPSLEAYCSVNTQGLATKIAMEGLTDRVTEIGRAIIRFFKALIEKIVNYIKKFRQKEKTLMDDVKKIKARLEKMDKDQKPKEKTFISSSTNVWRIRGFAYKSTDEVDYRRVIEVITNHTEVCGTFKAFPKHLNEISTSFSNCLNAKRRDSEEFSKEVEKMEATIEQVKGDVFKEMKSLEGKELIAKYTFDEKDNFLTYAIRGFDVRVGDAYIKVHTALISELNTVVVGIDTLLKAVEALVEEADHSYKLAEKTISNLENELKHDQAIPEESMTDKESISNFTKLVQEMNKFSSRLFSNYPKILGDCSLAAQCGILYCDACIEQY